MKTILRHFLATLTCIFTISAAQLTYSATSCFDYDVRAIRRQVFDHVSGLNALHVVVSELIPCDLDGIKNFLFEAERGRKRVRALKKSLSETEQLVVNIGLATAQPWFEPFIYDNGFYDELHKHYPATLRIYQSRRVRALINTLDGMDPGLLLEYLPFFKRVDRVRNACCGEGSGNTSDASKGLNFMLEDVRDVELARRSVAVRLLIQEQRYQVPRSTSYRLIYKHLGPDVAVIWLPRPHFRSRDILRLEAMLSSPYEFYREAAMRALYAL